MLETPPDALPSGLMVAGTLSLLPFTEQTPGRQIIDVTPWETEALIPRPCVCSWAVKFRGKILKRCAVVIPATCPTIQPTLFSPFQARQA